MVSREVLHAARELPSVAVHACLQLDKLRFFYVLSEVASD